MNYLIQKSLKSPDSDNEGLLVLSGIAMVAVIPLTCLWNPYVFSQGYGASVVMCSAALLLAFVETEPQPQPHPSLLVSLLFRPEGLLGVSAALYGLRLCLFLWFREWSVRNMRDQCKAFQHKLPTVHLLVMAVCCSILYACMVSPLLYALKRPPTNVGAVGVAWMGTVLSLVGTCLESIADLHKLIVKRKYGISYGVKHFVGPTSGLYAVCRHPNFLGEILFWTGLLLGGLPSFKTSWTAWISSMGGWICIVSIMMSSATRLDAKQQNWYGNQPPFKEWKSRVSASLIPRSL